MPVIKLRFINERTAYEYNKTLDENCLPPFELNCYWFISANNMFPGFSNHYLSNNNYAAQTHFVESFKFFYALLTDKVKIPGIDISDTDKAVISDKIQEGIPQCTQGFHNRINSLYERFFVPKTMASLTQRVRQSIINTGAYLHKNNQVNAYAGNEVHAVNFIVLQASLEGYGVEAANKHDNYGHLGITKDMAVIAAEGIFRAQYRPLKLIKMHIDELRSLLSNLYGYRGELEEESYDVGECQAFKQYLERLLDCVLPDVELFNFNEDYIEIIDINWQLITQKLWEKLKAIFTLETNESEALTALFETQDINSVDSMSHLKCIQTLFNSFDEHLLLTDIFSKLIGRNQVNLFDFLIKNSPSLLSEKNLLTLIEKNKHSSGYLFYLREQQRTSKSSYLLAFENEITSMNSQYYFLSACITNHDRPIQNVFSKFQILEPQKKVEILTSLGNEPKGLLDYMMTYDFNSRNQIDIPLTQRQKNQVASYKSLPKLFLALNDLNEHQLEHLFNCSDFINNALQYNRQCLSPILTLLKKAPKEVINFCLNANRNNSVNLLASLLNLNGALLSERDLFNTPLSLYQIETVIEDVLFLISKLLPSEREVLFYDFFSSAPYLLLTFYDSNLTKEQSIELFNLMNDSLIFSKINKLPSLNNSIISTDENINKIIFLMRHLDIKFVFNLMKKEITNNNIAWTSVTSIAREMFFSGYLIKEFNDYYDLLEKSEKKAISELIFKDLNEGDLSLWIKKMGATFDMSYFYKVIEMMPDSYRIKTLNHSISENKSHQDKLLLLMGNLELTECEQLFSVKIGPYGFKDDFYKTIIADDNYHKTINTYLKSISDDSARNYILAILFQDSERFIHTLMMKKEIKRSSVELTMQMPLVLKLEALKFAINNTSIEEKEIPNYIDIMKSLTEKELKEILLIIPSKEVKTFFQLVIERKPSQLFQLNRFLNDFNEPSTFCEKAIVEEIPFNDDWFHMLEGSLSELFTLLGHITIEKYFKLFNAFANIIEKEDDFKALLNLLFSLSKDQVKDVLGAKSSTKNKRFLEYLVLQKNHKAVIPLATDSIKKLPGLLNEATPQIFNIKTLGIDEHTEEPKIKGIFTFSFNLGRFSRKLSISWLKALNKPASFKIELLMGIKYLLSSEELIQLFAFDHFNQHSILHNLILSEGEVTQIFLTYLLTQLPNEKYYALFFEEPYQEGESKNLSLFDFLIKKNKNKTFLMLNGFVKECEGFELKEKILSQKIQLPEDFLSSSVANDEIPFDLLVNYMANQSSEEFNRQILTVLDESTISNKAEGLLQAIISNMNSGIKFFSLCIKEQKIKLLNLPYKNNLSFHTEFFYEFLSLNLKGGFSFFLKNSTSNNLNNIISDERFNINTIKIINSKLDHDSMIDFLKMIKENITPDNTDKLFSYKEEGQGVSSLFIRNNKCITEFFLCLSTLTHKKQIKLISAIESENTSLTIKYIMGIKRQLIILEEIRDNFSKKPYPHYQKAFKVLEGLTAELNHVFTAYLESDEAEKKQASEQLKMLLKNPSTIKVLNEHRGCKKIVLNVLAAIAGLGVGYLLGCAVNLYQTNGAHFFFHPQTDTKTAVDELLIAVNTL